MNCLKRDFSINDDMPEPSKRQRRDISSFCSGEPDRPFENKRICSPALSQSQVVCPMALLPSLLMKYYNIQGLSFERYLYEMD